MVIRSIPLLIPILYLYIPVSAAFIHCAGTRQKDPFRYQITAQPDFGPEGAQCREIARKRIVYGLFHLPLNSLPGSQRHLPDERLRFREIITWGDVGYTALGFLVSFITRTQILEACKLRPAWPRLLDYTLAFSPGSTVVSESQVPLLNQVAAEYRKRPGYLVIVGHSGLKEKPERVWQRTANVKSLLTEYGVPAARIRTVISGKGWPQNFRETGSRVEFFFWQENL